MKLYSEGWFNPYMSPSGWEGSDLNSRAAVKSHPSLRPRSPTIVASAAIARDLFVAKLSPIFTSWARTAACFG